MGDSVRMDFRKMGCGTRTGFFGLRIETNGRLL
jgi:hypothetical protein